MRYKCVANSENIGFFKKFFENQRLSMRKFIRSLPDGRGRRLDDPNISREKRAVVGASPYRSSSGECEPNSASLRSQSELRSDECPSQRKKDTRLGGLLFVKRLRKRYFCCSLIRFRTPTGLKCEISRMNLKMRT